MTLAVAVLLMGGLAPATSGAPPTIAAGPHATAQIATRAAATAPGVARASSFSPAWMRIAVQGPSARSYYGSAWDPLLSGMLVFGGCDGGTPWGGSTFCGSMTNETWAYEGGQWLNLTKPGGPSARVLPMIAYDPVDHGVLMFGGITGPANSDCLTDTWLYGASGWVHLLPSTTPGCSQTGIDFDGNLGHILLVASASGTDVSVAENLSWEFANSTWSQLPAPSSFDRSSPMMTYDSTDRETVLFGGFDLSCGCQNLDDTWVFKGGAWTEIFPSQSPGARNQAAFADDPGLGGVLLFAGHYAYQYYNDTWLFHNGSWTSLPTSVAPTYRWAMQMVTEPSTGQVLLFGGYNYTNSNPQFSNETWEYLYPSPLSSASVIATPSSVKLGLETSFDTTVSGGLGALTFVYLGLPAGCASANVSFLLCSPTTTGTFDILVNVTDQVGRSIIASTPLSVTPGLASSPLTLSEFVAVPPVVVVGASLTLVTVTSGGSGGSTFTYSGLPAGCASLNSSALTCVPTQAGSATVGVSVRDSVGETTAGNVTVSVLAPPTPPVGPAVVGLTQFPAPGTVGHLLAFSTQTSGGVGPLTFAYAGLPAGCQSTNTSVLLCVPSAAGLSTVTVTVSDSLGRTAEENVSATVDAAQNTTPVVVVNSSGGASSSGLPNTLVDVALVLAIAAVVVAVVGMLRSRPPSSGPTRTP